MFSFMKNFEMLENTRASACLGLTSNTLLFTPTVTLLLFQILASSPAVARNNKLMRPASENLFLSVMTYNVENLFDTKDDPRKKDETYLPISKKSAHLKKCNGIRVKKWKHLCLNLDWNKKRLRQKIENLAAVIMSVNQGTGADILILQEVENKLVLEQLRERLNSKKNVYYPGILIESEDRRGIDVAILSKLPVQGEPLLHKIPFITYGKISSLKTRGILEARLEASNGDIIAVFGVHFPAPYYKSHYRIQSMDFLTQLSNQALTKTGGLGRMKTPNVIIAGGDFNNTWREEKKIELYRKHAQTNWLVSHLINSSTSTHSKITGTYFYQRNKSWSYLDAIMIRQGSQLNGWKVIGKSIKIVTGTKNQTDPLGRPVPFQIDRVEPVGASDHLPVYLKLVRE